MQCEFENEGTKLVGEIFEPESYNGNAVILSHGFGESKENYYNFTEALQNEGFLVMAYDLRSHGESGGSFDLDLMVDDVYAAADYLRENYDINKLGVFGHSLAGYTVALAAADKPDDFDLVITLAAPNSPREALMDAFPLFPMMELYALNFGPYLNYSVKYCELRIDHMGEFLNNLYDRSQRKLTDYVGNMKDTPYVILHGDRDNIVPTQHAEKIFEAANGTKEIVCIGDSKNSEDTFEEPTNMLKELALLEKTMLDKGPFNTIDKTKELVILDDTGHHKELHGIESWIIGSLKWFGLESFYPLTEKHQEIWQNTCNTTVEKFKEYLLDEDN